MATEVAHLARGELVVPWALQSPEVVAVLQRAAAAHDIPFEMLSVGNAMNRINPETSARNFGLRECEIVFPISSKMMMLMTAKRYRTVSLLAALMMASRMILYGASTMNESVSSVRSTTQEFCCSL